MPQKFTPDLIPNLHFWFEADQQANNLLWQDSGQTTLVSADGQPVGFYQDASANALGFSQPTNANRPVWKATAGPGGKPSILFSAASTQYLIGTSGSGAATTGLSAIGKSSYTLFFVVQPASVPAYSAILAKSAPADSRFFFLLNNGVFGRQPSLSLPPPLL